MATMATNHVTVAMGQVATTSLPRYSHFFISNYIIPSHYDQMLFFSVYKWNLKMNFIKILLSTFQIITQNYKKVVKIGTVLQLHITINAIDIN